jgi:hypothetical protein
MFMRRLLLSVILFAVGGTANADPWKDESGHGKGLRHWDGDKHRWNQGFEGETPCCSEARAIGTVISSTLGLARPLGWMGTMDTTSIQHRPIATVTFTMTTVGATRHDSTHPRAAIIQIPDTTTGNIGINDQAHITQTGRWRHPAGKSIQPVHSLMSIVFRGVSQGL